jgi:hypothetical protein
MPLLPATLAASAPQSERSLQQTAQHLAGAGAHVERHGDGVVDHHLGRQPVAPARAWVIRNARLDPEWASMERRTLGITGRAITAMIAASGYNDVLRIYAAAERDGVDYNLAHIGRDFTMEYDEPFEPSYMRPLFEYGRQRALRGDAWAKRPPI